MPIWIVIQSLEGQKPLSTISITLIINRFCYQWKGTWIEILKCKLLSSKINIDAQRKYVNFIPRMFQWNIGIRVAWQLFQ